VLIGDEKGLGGEHRKTTCRYGESLGWTAVLKMLPQLQGHYSEIARGFDSPRDL